MFFEDVILDPGFSTRGTGTPKGYLGCHKGVQGLHIFKLRKKYIHFIFERSYDCGRLLSSSEGYWPRLSHIKGYLI